MRRAAKGITTRPKPSAPTNRIPQTPNDTNTNATPTCNQLTPHDTEPNNTTNKPPLSNPPHAHPRTNAPSTHDLLPLEYILEALPTEEEFRTMNDSDAINSICMVIPVDENEVKQTKRKLHTPHTWHDVAKTIINSSNIQLEDTNMIIEY
jgi:hypothetical protein